MMLLVCYTANSVLVAAAAGVCLIFRHHLIDAENFSPLYT